MHKPKVSFVVPCYRLAHLLGECINSILSQTYADFEVLIMDDCSPDDTAEVARSFKDERVRHIRNESNLGPLRNYNKGITLSSGKYVWLISADDYLRSHDVLERYVEVLERNPRVGYVFCPGVSVINGHESEIIENSKYGSRDKIVKGHAFLKAISNGCFVLAASAMARRECYDKVSLFPVSLLFEGTPIDLVWGGDWYLWSVFALFFDVAYFAEPMVCYRQHELSSTESVTRKRIDNCILTDIGVPWMVKQKAEEAGFHDVYKTCLNAVAIEYARHLTGKEYRSGTWAMTTDQFEESLRRNSQSETERNWIRARAYASAADRYYYRGDLTLAKQLYWAGLKRNPMMAKVYVKLLLLSLGKAGHAARLRFKKMIPSYSR
jgi:glycosyltransferase involved in cell wall biosynthesis